MISHVTTGKEKVKLSTAVNKYIIPNAISAQWGPGGMGEFPRDHALPPSCPPSTVRRRKKIQKSAIFGKFLDLAQTPSHSVRSAHGWPRVVARYVPPFFTPSWPETSSWTWLFPKTPISLFFSSSKPYIRLKNHPVNFPKNCISKPQNQGKIQFFSPKFDKISSKSLKLHQKISSLRPQIWWQSIL